MPPTSSQKHSRALTPLKINEVKVQLTSSHANCHATHAPSTHAPPPPVKGGGVRAPCRCPDLIQVLTAEGFDVRLDPAPLGPLEELAACVAGCHTFTRHDVSGAVHGRTPFVIRTRPAGTRLRQTVLAEHRCTPPVDVHAPGSL